MSEGKDIVGEAIKKTFSISSVDSAFHDAIKELEALQERITLSFNRIDMMTDDMTHDEICNVMMKARDTLSLLTNRAYDLSDFIWGKR